MTPARRRELMAHRIHRETTRQGYGCAITRDDRGGYNALPVGPLEVQQTETGTRAALAPEIRGEDLPAAWPAAPGTRHGDPRLPFPLAAVAQDLAHLNPPDRETPPGPAALPAAAYHTLAPRFTGETRWTPDQGWT